MATGATTKQDSATQAREAIQQGVTRLLDIVEQQRLESNPDLLHSLDRLRERVASQEVTLTVLGEFDAGKTTFINALLRTNLLSTGILPTTAICTYISYGEVSSCEATLKNGKKVAMSVGCSGQFPVEGSPKLEVDSVRVKMPLPLLKEGLVVVDTPGVNVTIEEHELVTASAIAESNACVYMMDARQPGKKTTVEFLRSIHQQIDKFFFVLNRADIYDSGEEQEALEFVTNALVRECGVRNPRVFVLSSRLATPERTGPWGERFVAFEQELQGFMHTDRQFVIANEVGRLAIVASQYADHLLSAKWSLAELELATHHKTCLPESSELIETLKRGIRDRVDVDRSALLRDLGGVHQRVVGTLRENIAQQIELAKSKEDLAGPVARAINTCFYSAGSELYKYVIDDIQESFNDLRALVIRDVEQLLSGVRMLEERAFFSRLSPYIYASVGGLGTVLIGLVLGGVSNSGGMILTLLGCAAVGSLAGLFVAYRLFKRHNRSEFALPGIDNLDHRKFAVPKGALLQYGTAGQELIKEGDQLRASGKGIRDSGRRAGFQGVQAYNMGGGGNPVMQVIGLGRAAFGIAELAVGAITSTVGRIQTSAGRMLSTIEGWFAPSLESVKRELLSNSLATCERFERESSSEAHTFVQNGYDFVLKDLTETVDAVVTRYERVIESLVNRQRRVTNALEHRRTEIRQAVVSLDEVQKQTTIAAAAIKHALLHHPDGGRP